MRVGIFTGRVTVGSLGSKQRLEYGIIGDTVNIASRLESCERERQPCDCRILIAQERLQYVPRDRYEFESWGAV
jgi:adenylate cyclase